MGLFNKRDIISLMCPLDSFAMMLIDDQMAYTFNEIRDIYKRLLPGATDEQIREFINRNMDRCGSGFYALNKRNKDAPFYKVALDAATSRTVSHAINRGTRGLPSVGTSQRPPTPPQSSKIKVIEKIRFAEKYNIPYEGLIELIKEMRL